jgi:hypothetical protein
VQGRLKDLFFRSIVDTAINPGTSNRLNNPFNERMVKSSMVVIVTKSFAGQRTGLKGLDQGPEAMRKGVSSE